MHPKLATAPGPAPARRRAGGRGFGTAGHLVLSDFDPEGEDIAHSFARSMRDDFGIDQIELVKVALTDRQVREMGMGLSDEEALPWLERWDAGNRPPLGCERLLEVIRNARTYGRRDIGSGLGDDGPRRNGRGRDGNNGPAPVDTAQDIPPRGQTQTCRTLAC